MVCYHVISIGKLLILLCISKDSSIFDVILLHLMWKRLISFGTLLNVCCWRKHCLWLFFPGTFHMYIYFQYRLETSCKFLLGEWHFHLCRTLKILNSESWKEWTTPSSILKCLYELWGRALITADGRVLILDRNIQVVIYKMLSFCMDIQVKTIQYIDGKEIAALFCVIYLNWSNWEMHVQWQQYNVMTKHQCTLLDCLWLKVSLCTMTMLWTLCSTTTDKNVEQWLSS